MAAWQTRRVRHNTLLSHVFRSGDCAMINGGCMCGTVRYRTNAEPIITRLCWCRVCQYIAAGNAAVGVCFPLSGMVVEGETRDFASIADSGNKMHRRFCPTAEPTCSAKQSPVLT